MSELRQQEQAQQQRLSAANVQLTKELKGLKGDSMRAAQDATIRIAALQSDIRRSGRVLLWLTSLLEGAQQDSGSGKGGTVEGG